MLLICVDMSSMFKNCKNIDALNLTSFETNKVKNMKSMFESCTKLKSILINLVLIMLLILLICLKN